ncbi:serine protease 7-like [Anopheles marshallii]|uniref:serine protease 7-like n=1 Tax=Anopheles marshallii TaxID=1521116 RepID=UPI00237B1D84|nr:serine protease 7-like [Anopheles marshallii]
MLALLWKVFLVVVVLGCETVTAGDRPCQTRSAKPQQGRCVPVSKCPAIKQHLLRLQFSPAEMFEAFLSERACSYGKDGTLHVCCTGKIASERRAELAANDAHQCPEECAALEDCPAVYGRSMVLQKRYDRRLHKLLRENFCYEKSGQLFVCCDPERYPSSITAGTRELAKRVSWQSCVTPFGDDGKCVPPARCAMVDNPDTIASELEAFTIGCNPVGNQSQLCCTESLLIFDQEAGKECETKEGLEGMCTESERCLDFIESDEKDVYVRRNWCYTNLQQVDYLCCAQTRIKEAPQIEFGIRAGEELPACTTIVNRAGYCVPLAQCGPVARLLRLISTRGTSATPDEARFLRGSICTTPEGATGYHVCCDVTAVQTTTTAAPVTIAPTTVAPTTASLLNHRNTPLFDRSNCGLPGTNNKIAFGQQARLFQYPWMAMIVYMSSTTGTESAECAGTIINVRYILTAAHCIDGQMERIRYVRIGEFDTRTDPDCEEDTCAAPIQRYGVEDAVFHPNFTRIVRSGHDVGLLRLNRTIDFSSGDVSPVCLPFTSGLMGFDPTLYWITGWGLTERLEVSPVLLQARIPPVSCSLSSYAICAGFGNATLHCEGDSGGPMKAQVPEYNFRFVQYGVISAGPRCGTQGVPGISSRVSFFMQWILDNIKA